MTGKGLRFGVQSDGARYVARDRSRRCEHAVWNEKANRVDWLAHAIGGTMKPFLGPDDVYRELCQGGLELWKDDAA